jgi:sterol desaturase/sphingolipid hydroxylase (fatty acid hydroxylase superfamily)
MYFSMSITNYKRMLLGPYFTLQLCCCSVEILYPFITYSDYNILCLHFFIGCGLWNITEYIYHRFLQHHFFYASHKSHHTNPSNEKYIHLSFLLTQGLSPLFIYILYSRIGIFSGFIFSGLVFELSHFISHNYLDTNITKFIFKETKRYHTLHHKKETSNFGFLTPTYDYIFNTMNDKSEYRTHELLLGLVFPILLFVNKF